MTMISQRHTLNPKTWKFQVTELEPVDRLLELAEPHHSSFKSEKSFLLDVVNLNKQEHELVSTIEFDETSGQLFFFFVPEKDDNWSIAVLDFI